MSYTFKCRLNESSRTRGKEEEKYISHVAMTFGLEHCKMRYVVMLRKIVFRIANNKTHVYTFFPFNATRVHFVTYFLHARHSEVHYRCGAASPFPFSKIASFHDFESILPDTLSRDSSRRNCCRQFAWSSSLRSLPLARRSRQQRDCRMGHRTEQSHRVLSERIWRRHATIIQEKYPQPA